MNDLNYIDTTKQDMLRESSSDEAETGHSSPDSLLEDRLPDVIIFEKSLPLDAVNEFVGDSYRPNSTGETVDSGQRSGASSRISNLSETSSNTSNELNGLRTKHMVIEELKSSIEDGIEQINVDHLYPEFQKKSFTQIYTSGSGKLPPNKIYPIEVRNRGDSVSSYESCINYIDGGNEDKFETLAGQVKSNVPYGSVASYEKRDIRSGSETSYESAPPPPPDVPPPVQSSISSRSRSSSSASSAVSRPQSTDDTDNKSKWSSIQKSMVFSISTYKSRAEETSYERKVVKTGSFNKKSKPDISSVDSSTQSSLISDAVTAAANNTSSLPRTNHEPHPEYHKDTNTLPIIHDTSNKSNPHRHSTTLNIPDIVQAGNALLNSKEAKLRPPEAHQTPAMLQTPMPYRSAAHADPLRATMPSSRISLQPLVNEASDLPLELGSRSGPPTVTRGLSFNDRRAVFTPRNAEAPKICGFKPEVAKKPTKRFPVS